MKKTTLVKNDYFHIYEKNKKGSISLVIEPINLDKTEEISFSDFDINIEDSGYIRVFLFDKIISEFGYSESDFKLKNMNWKQRKVKTKKNKFVINIPLLLTSAVSKKDILKGFSDILNSFEGEAFSTVRKKDFAKLEKLYHKVLKNGIV